MARHLNSIGSISRFYTCDCKSMAKHILALCLSSILFCASTTSQADCPGYFDIICGIDLVIYPDPDPNTVKCATESEESEGVPLLISTPDTPRRYKVEIVVPNDIDSGVDLVLNGELPEGLLLYDAATGGNEVSLPKTLTTPFNPGENIFYLEASLPTGNVMLSLKYDGVPCDKLSVYTGCTSCTDCDGAGEAEPNLSSLSFKVGLGNINYGDSAGYIYIYSKHPDASLYTPAALQVNIPAAGSGVTVSRTGGVITSVATTNSRIDVANELTYSYELHVKDGPLATDAIIKKILIKNPNGAADDNTLDITEEGGTNRAWQFQWSDVDASWTLAEGESNGLNVSPTMLQKTVREYGRVSAVEHTETVTIEQITGGGDVVIRKTQERYYQFPWGQELIERVVDPDDDAITDQWFYYDDAANDDEGDYSRLKVRVTDAGGWEWYDYDTDGVLVKKITQYGDESYTDYSTAPSESANVVTTYEITNPILTHPYRTQDSIGDELETITEVNRGSSTEKTVSYRIKWSGTVTKDGESCEETWNVAGGTVTSAWNDYSKNLISKTWRITSGSNIHKVKQSLSSDGQMSIYTYPSAGTTTVARGFPDDPTDPDPQIVFGIRTTTLVGGEGDVVESYTERTETGSSWYGVSLTKHANPVDPDTRVSSYYFGLQAELEYAPATSGTAAYTTQVNRGCCGVQWRTDRNGITTHYVYDGLGRMIETTREFEIALDTYTKYSGSKTTYDADSSNDGRKLISERYVMADPNGAPTNSFWEVERTTHYDVAGRVWKTIDAAGKATFTTYQKVTDGGNTYDETPYYPHDNTSGPVRVTWTDSHGHTYRTFDASTTDSWSVVSPPSGGETLVALTQTEFVYDWKGRQKNVRNYFLPGTPMAYYETVSNEYDALGRQFKTTDVLGNISETQYDAQGRAISQWQGTSAGMTKVSETWYDVDYSRDGSDFRPYPTRVSQLKPLASIAYTNTDFAATQGQDEGESWTKPEVGPWSRQETDEQGRVTFSELYANGSMAAEDLLAQTENIYDSGTGQLVEIRVYEVDGSGDPGSYLKTTFTYDLAGRQVKSERAGGGFSKTAFDRRGRIARTVSGSDEGSGAPVATSGDYIGLTDFTGDTILVETEYEYDAADNVIQTTRYDRNHDATATGLLSDPGNIDDARVTYAANWYDNAHRLTDTANYGTTSPTSPLPSSAPANQTNTVLVNSTSYDSAGRVDTVTDNANITTKYYYDALGRQTYVVENPDDFDGTAADENDAGDSSDSDKDRVTKYVYDSASQIVEQTALMNTGTADDQTTTYTYGGENVSDSPVKRKDLLLKVEYPDGDDVNDNVQMTYYANGAIASRADQRGVKLVYGYDNANRRTIQLIDPAGTSAAGDQSVVYTYTPLGQLDAITSYSDLGVTATSQVKYQYNDLGQVVAEYQQHGGAVNLSTSPKVEYDYDDTLASSEFTKGARLRKTTYPNGREIYWVYDGHSGIDDAIGRVNTLADAHTTTADTPGDPIVSYTYLGSGRMARKDYPTPDVRLDYIDESVEGIASDPYELSLDRFGRVIRHQWEAYDGANGDGDYFNIKHGYDYASNRKYADRQVYKSHSQHYIYDSLHRLEDYQAGKTDYDTTPNPDVPQGIEDFWALNGRGYALDPLGNQIAVTTPDATDYYQNDIDDGEANEYTTRKVKSDIGASEISDTFDNNNAINDGEWVKDGTDTYTISGGNLTVTNAINDGDDDGEWAVLLKGEAVGPFTARFSVKFPGGAPAGSQAGLVFGYTSPGNYWLYVIDMDNDEARVYQVEGGAIVTSTPPAQSVDTISAGGAAVSYDMASKRFTANALFNSDFELAGGFPSGKFGLWTNTDGVVFESVDFQRDAPAADLAGRWINPANGYIHDVGSGDGRLRIPATTPSTTRPILLDGVRAERFEATFKMHRTSASTAAGYFILGASDTDDYIAVKLTHASSGVAPTVYEVNNGHSLTLVSHDSSYPANVPNLGQNDALWVKITSDDTTLTIICDDDSGFGNPACYTTTFAKLTRPGSMFGFMGSSETVDFDTLVLKSDHDDDQNYDVTEHKDNFDIDSNGDVEQNLAYDEAGNLIYDGKHAFEYDGWNRLIEVAKAYPNPSPGSGYSEGSVVATMQYDALGRRIVKEVQHASNLNTTYHYFYDGQSVIQTDNGAPSGGQMLKQYVWGLQYIDELCQVGVNQDPANADSSFSGLDTHEENEAEKYYFALQDANYNVLGVVSEAGRLVERYEYTPYGQRNVYSHAIIPGDVDGDGFVGTNDLGAITGNYDQNVEGPNDADLSGDGRISSPDLQIVLANFNKGISTGNNNDPLVTHTRLQSARFTSHGLASLGPALCEVGHQGLFHDEEFGSQGGLIHNRARTLHPSLGRFMQRDPLGYVDGMNILLIGASNPINYLDAGGTATIKVDESWDHDKLVKVTEGLIDHSNQKGWVEAAKNLKYWLDGHGGTRVVDEETIDWLNDTKWGYVLASQLSHGDPEYFNPRFEISMKKAETRPFDPVLDYWDYQIKLSTGFMGGNVDELDVALGTFSIQAQGAIVCGDTSGGNTGFNNDAVGIVRYILYDDYDWVVALKDFSGETKYNAPDGNTYIVTDAAMKKLEGPPTNAKPYRIRGVWARAIVCSNENSSWACNQSSERLPAPLTIDVFNHHFDWVHEHDPVGYKLNKGKPGFQDDIYWTVTPSGGQ